MTTAVVTGTISDAAEIPMEAEGLQLVFKLNRFSGTTENLAVVTRQIVVTPDAHGFWSQEFVPNELIVGESWYSYSARWLDPNYFGDGSGYTGVDFPDSKMWVPVAGGTFTDLLGTPSTANPAIWWVSLTEPVGTQALNTWWLNGDPNDETAGTGEVMKWS